MTTETRLPLTADNTFCEEFSMCFAKGDFRHNQGLVSAFTDPALNFGGCIHAGLASYYRGEGPEKAKATAVKSWQPIADDPDQPRTPEKLIEVLEQYLDWPHNGFDLVMDKDGKPLVEVSAAYPLLTASDPDRIREKLVSAGYTSEIIYTGIIDLPIMWSGQLSAVDHKTCTWLYTPKDKPSYINQDFWAGFELSKQFKGYRWLLNQHTGEQGGSFVLNAIGISKANSRNCFERRDFLWTPSQLEEWRLDRVALLEMYLDCKLRGYWPTSGAHYYCNAYHKPCPYKEMCSAPPERRKDMLGLYKVEKWEPLKARKQEMEKIGETQ